MAQFEVSARLEFNTTVTVEARDADEARDIFRRGQFVDDGLGGAEMVNWEARSAPRET